jgi:hypothetical protein
LGVEFLLTTPYPGRLTCADSLKRSTKCSLFAVGHDTWCRLTVNMLICREADCSVICTGPGVNIHFRTFFSIRNFAFFFIKRAPKFV